jgi:mannosyl-3-phosphoglycerate phosphatase
VTPDRVVFSGVGGGLLQRDTLSYDPARPAIAALARLEVPVVLCSSRPRSEVMLVSRLLGLGAPMIVENGAALVVPAGHLRGGVPGGQWDGEFHVLSLGPPREALREALVEVAAAARVEVRVPPAADREHTEPFLLETETEADASALAREAAVRGLRVFRGETLYYLCGGADKGLAARMLLSLYEREGRLPRAIALGTWQVDLPMLRAAHRPVVLPGPGGSVEPLLAAELPHGELAPRGGPEGWNDAVLAILAGQRLPTLGPCARSGEGQPGDGEAAQALGRRSSELGARV